MVLVDDGKDERQTVGEKGNIEVVDEILDLGVDGYILLGRIER